MTKTTKPFEPKQFTELMIATYGEVDAFVTDDDWKSVRWYLEELVLRPLNPERSRAKHLGICSPAHDRQSGTCGRVSLS